jgi:hypothetical protein
MFPFQACMIISMAETSAVYNEPLARNLPSIYAIIRSLMRFSLQ